MELLKESIDRMLDEQEMIPVYPIGTEVILTTVFDGIKCYCIDKITEISITEDGVTYYFDEASMKLNERDIIPYSIKNEDTIKSLDYEYSRSGYGFKVLYNKDLRENKMKLVKESKVLKEEDDLENLKKAAKAYQKDLKAMGTNYDKLYDYVSDALDYDFNVDSKKEYNSAKIWVGLGGPNVCLDTDDATIKVYWGGKKYEEPYSYSTNDVLDEIMEEIYNND